MGFFDKFLGKETTAKQIESEDQHEVNGENVKVIEIGSSGTELFAGYLQEEYLQDLRGKEAADIFDKMRRSDPKVKMITSAMKNPIAAASWEISGTEDEETVSGAQQKELIEHILFNDMGKTWDRFVREALSMIDFGYSLFEVTYKAEINHPKFGAYNGLKSMAFRSQRTIERWNIKRSGKLASVYQQAFGDGQDNVEIPADYLLHFAIDMEGDNFEGISILRPAYGPWLRKNQFLRLMAAGVEKYAIPIPKLEVPTGKEQTAEYKKAKEALRAYVSHRCNYIMVPAGWKLDLTTNNFDADKVRSVIDGENVEIVNAALANFLELGQSGSGSYALGSDLSDFFLGGLEYVADQITEVINTVLIPKLVKLNFADGIVRCKLKHSGIRDKAGKELADVVKVLVDSGVVMSDDRLEESLRKRFGLPEKEESTERETPEQKGIFNFAEKKQKKKSDPVESLIDRSTKILQDSYQTNLDKIQSEMIDKVRTHLDRSKGSQKLKISKDKLMKVPGILKYKKELKENLSKIYNDSIERVQKETPSSMKLNESAKLDQRARTRVNTDVQNAIDVQIDDLAKAISLQYAMSVESTDSTDIIAQDIKEASDKPIQRAVTTGALIQASKTVNDGRRDFFGEFKEEIESFTWINNSPVSEICKHLSGRTIPADHPDVERYWPPLHHNCKTYVVANTATTRNNPETQNGFSPPKTALSSITLSECGCGDEK